MNQFLSTLLSWCANTGVKIVISAVIIIVTFWLINFLAKKLAATEKFMKLDKTLGKTLIAVGKVVLKVLVVVGIVGYLGIDTSGITALIASCGVCFGLAVNGAVGNIAGGILLLITRPFNVGDYIKCADAEGVVKEINLVATKILTIDNKVVYLPNGTASTATVVNFSEEPLRRVDLTFEISYDDDFETAERVILAILGAHELVLDEPAPQVRVIGYQQSSITIVSRAWCKSEDYWTVFFDLQEAIRKGFQMNDIRVPYQQLDVHMKND